MSIGLTKKELVVLQFVAEGLTSTEIADEMGLGLETIKTHRKSVKAKLGAPNMVNAAVRATLMGAIDTGRVVEQLSAREPGGEGSAGDTGDRSALGYAARHRFSQPGTATTRAAEAAGPAGVVGESRPRPRRRRAARSVRRRGGRRAPGSPPAACSSTRCAL
jgi:DNA-binding CsgD family transcriptional regulator